MRPSSGGSRRISKWLLPAWACVAISTARPASGTAAAWACACDWRGRVRGGAGGIDRGVRRVGRREAAEILRRVGAGLTAPAASPRLLRGRRHAELWRAGRRRRVEFAGALSPSPRAWPSLPVSICGHCGLRIDGRCALGGASPWRPSAGALGRLVAPLLPWVWPGLAASARCARAPCPASLRRPRARRTCGAPSVRRRASPRLAAAAAWRGRPAALTRDGGGLRRDDGRRRGGGGSGRIGRGRCDRRPASACRPPSGSAAAAASRSLICLARGGGLGVASRGRCRPWQFFGGAFVSRAAADRSESPASEAGLPSLGVLGGFGVRAVVGRLAGVGRFGIGAVRPACVGSCVGALGVALVLGRLASARSFAALAESARSDRSARSDAAVGVAAQAAALSSSSANGVAGSLPSASERLRVAGRNGGGTAGWGAVRTRRWARRTSLMQTATASLVCNRRATARQRIINYYQWLTEDGGERPGAGALPAARTAGRARAETACRDGALHCAATVAPYSNERSLIPGSAGARRKPRPECSTASTSKAARRTPASSSPCPAASIPR